MPTKRKDGRWQEQLTITEGGRPKQKYFYGRTKQEVLKKIAAWQQRAAVGPAFAEVADAWWAEKEREVADGTVKSYIAALSRARAWFGDTPVTEITPVDVRRFMADYVDRARPAKKTAVTQRQIVRNIMGSLIGIASPRSADLRPQPVQLGLQRLHRHIFRRRGGLHQCKPGKLRRPGLHIPSLDPDHPVAQVGEYHQRPGKVRWRGLRLLPARNRAGCG